MGPVADSSYPYSCEEVARVSRAARLLVVRWAATVALLSLLVVGCTALVVVAARYAPVQGWWAIACLWLPVAAAFLLYQLVPLAPEHPDAVVPVGEQASRLSDWVEAQTGWRTQVTLVEQCVLVTVGPVGPLVIGMPLVAGLTERELSLMVGELDWDRRAEAVAPFAMRLLRGSLGRSLWGRSDARFGRWLVGSLATSLQRLDDACGRLGQQRRAADPAWQSVAERVGVVAEAWELVCETWLGPALLHHRQWHATPFSGLSLLLDAGELAGVVPPSGRAGGERPALESAAFAAHEHEVAGWMVQERRLDARAISWEDHPRHVTVQEWRAQAAEGLVAAGALAGRPVAASARTLADAVAEQREAWVASFTRSPTDPDRPGEPGHRAALGAMARLVLVESGRCSPQWQWPRGTILVDALGEEVQVPPLEDPEALVAWLTEVGLAADEPIWLGDGRRDDAGRAVVAFEVTQGLRPRRLVLSTQALHLFPRGGGPLLSLRTQWQGPHRAHDPAMQQVDDGAVPATVRSTRWVDVASLELRSWPDGCHHRLLLRDVDGRRLSVLLTGLPADVPAVLSRVLGDRFRAPWLARRRSLRRLRVAWFWVASTGGLLMLLVAGMGWAQPTPDANRADWLQLGGAGLLLVLSTGLSELVVARRDAARRPSRDDLVALARPDPATSAGPH